MGSRFTPAAEPPSVPFAGTKSFAGCTLFCCDIYALIGDWVVTGKWKNGGGRDEKKKKMVEYKWTRLKKVIAASQVVRPSSDQLRCTPDQDIDGVGIG